MMLTHFGFQFPKNNLGSVGLLVAVVSGTDLRNVWTGNIVRVEKLVSAGNSSTPQNVPLCNHHKLRKPVGHLESADLLPFQTLLMFLAQESY